MHCPVNSRATAIETTRFFHSKCYVFHIDRRLKMSEKFSKWNDACFTNNKKRRQWNYFSFLKMTNDMKETIEERKKKNEKKTQINELTSGRPKEFEYVEELSSCFMCHFVLLFGSQVSRLAAQVTKPKPKTKNRKKTHTAERVRGKRKKYENAGFVVWIEQVFLLCSFSAPSSAIAWSSSHQRVCSDEAQRQTTATTTVSYLKHEFIQNIVQNDITNMIHWIANIFPIPATKPNWQSASWLLANGKGNERGKKKRNQTTATGKKCRTERDSNWKWMISRAHRDVFLFKCQHFVRFSSFFFFSLARCGHRTSNRIRIKKKNNNNTTITLKWTILSTIEAASSNLYIGRLRFHKSRKHAVLSSASGIFFLLFRLLYAHLRLTQFNGDCCCYILFVCLFVCWLLLLLLLSFVSSRHSRRRSGLNSFITALSLCNKFNAHTQTQETRGI